MIGTFFFLREPSKQTCRNIDPTKEDLPEEGIYNQNANHEKNNRYFSTSKCLELLFLLYFLFFKPPSWEQKSMTPKHKSKPMVHCIDTSTKTFPLTLPCTLLYLRLCCTTGILVFSLIESEHLEHLVLWNEFYSSALSTQIGSKPVWDQRQLKHLASFSAKKSQWGVIISQLWTRQVKLWLSNATAYRCIQ